MARDAPHRIVGQTVVFPSLVQQGAARDLWLGSHAVAAPRLLLCQRVDRERGVVGAFLRLPVRAATRLVKLQTSDLSAKFYFITNYDTSFIEPAIVIK